MSNKNENRKVTHLQITQLFFTIILGLLTLYVSYRNFELNRDIYLIENEYDPRVIIRTSDILLLQPERYTSEWNTQLNINVETVAPRRGELIINKYNFHINNEEIHKLSLYGSYDVSFNEKNIIIEAEHQQNDFTIDIVAKFRIDPFHIINDKSIYLGDLEMEIIYVDIQSKKSFSQFVLTKVIWINER